MSSEFIGQMILYHRKKSGLSRDQLALLAGVGKTVVFDVEKGKMTVKFATLLKILHVLNLSIVFKGPYVEEFLNEKM